MMHDEPKNALPLASDACVPESGYSPFRARFKTEPPVGRASSSGLRLELSRLQSSLTRRVINNHISIEFREREKRQWVLPSRIQRWRWWGYSVHPLSGEQGSNLSLSHKKKSRRMSGSEHFSLRVDFIIRNKLYPSATYSW